VAGGFLLEIARNRQHIAGFERAKQKGIGTREVSDSGREEGTYRKIAFNKF